jgi:uncharacterized protein
VSRRRKAQHLQRRRPHRGKAELLGGLYHGGVPGLQPGDTILPAATSGAAIQNAGRLHRGDRVYLTDSRETAAMYALEYDGGTVYEVQPDGPLEVDPESQEWMRGWMAASATVVCDLGSLCICGSGKAVDACCGEAVVEQVRWAKLNPELLQKLSACRTLAVLPFFTALACDAPPTAIRSSIHGPAHWEQVASNGLYLGFPADADLRVVLAFALLHDAFRENDGHDPKHGERAADWAAQNADKLEGIVPLEELIYALHHHADGHVTDNSTIGVCWDADRIDLVRVGIVPDGDLMSTDLGRQIAGKLGEPSVAATAGSF